MSRKASGRKETRSLDSENLSVGFRDQILYLYTFEIKKRTKLIKKTTFKENYDVIKQKLTQVTLHH